LAQIKIHLATTPIWSSSRMKRVNCGKDLQANSCRQTEAGGLCPPQEDAVTPREIALALAEGL
jgi:hypothetical protein